MIDTIALCLLDSLWKCCVVAAAVSFSRRYWVNYAALIVMVGWSAMPLFEGRDSLAGSILSVGLQTFQPGGAPQGLSWNMILVRCWMVGVAALSLRWFLQWNRIQLARRSGPIYAEVTGFVASACKRIGLPAVTVVNTGAVGLGVAGWLRPVIFLPASAVSGLDRQQLEAILYHELAHIRRHDYFWNMLQTAIDTLLFFHPAERWISRRVRQEREHRCDDLAAEWCGDRRVFAGALLALEECRSTSGLAAANGGSLALRIRRLMGQPVTQRAPFAGLAVIAAAGLFAILLQAGEVPAQHSRPVDVSFYAVVEIVEFKDVPAAEQRVILERINVGIGDRLDIETRHRIGRELGKIGQKKYTFSYKPGAAAGTTRLIISSDC